MTDSTLPSHLTPGPLLEGRTAVVTGGAGAVADAICRSFAAHGASLVVADVDAKRTAATVSAVEALGAKAVGFVADLTAAGAVEELSRAALDAFGQVDILINALGEHLAFGGPFENSSEEQWQALYEVNLLATLRCSHAFIPGMKERGWGRIINFSSVEGIRSMPSGAVYTAFKGAIDSFTKSLGVDLAHYGIRANAIAVDKTRSYQVNHYRMPAEYDPFIPVWIPAGRFGEGTDVASVALFLASELGAWVVGQTIPADGGTLAAGGWYRTPTRWTNSPLLAQYLEDPEVTKRRPPNLR